jgi:hypothetical protein
LFSKAGGRGTTLDRNTESGTYLLGIANKKVPLIVPSFLSELLNSLHQANIEAACCYQVSLCPHTFPASLNGRKEMLKKKKKEKLLLWVQEIPTPGTNGLM